MLVSEDEWLGALFADQMSSLTDYVRCAAKLRAAMEPHIVSLLKAGISVVLDFPANTITQRAWMRDLFQKANTAHVLHYLDVPEDVCLERLRLRNASGQHPFSVSEEQFRQLCKHFVPPTKEEGFEIVTHRYDASDNRG